MSESMDPAPADEVPPQLPTEVSSNELPVPHADWFLQKLVEFANQFSLEFGVTLQVSGMLVSGTVVSGKRYFESFASSFSAGFVDFQEAGEAMKELIENYKGIYESGPAEEAQRPPPEFIHLLNARFFQPGQKPIPDGGQALWRGRLSEVGGFFLGSLTPPSAE